MPSSCSGRDAIAAFLTRKWQRELDYRLIKELWAFHDNRIAVRFAYEWHDDSGNWFRSYGNENWEFDEHGLMRRRIASINDLPDRAGRAQVPLAARSPSGRSPLVERSGPLTRPRPRPMRVCMKQARVWLLAGDLAGESKSRCPQDESHDHDHGHDLPHAEISRSGRPGYYEVMETAVRELLIEKQLIGADEIRRQIEVLDSRTPALGAKVVARAWVDPAFKARLLANGRAACEELGISFYDDTGLIVLENTDQVHNLIVCTLCSCYPRPVLGLPPDWYKLKPYRARAVIEPRAVLAEFGTVIPEEVEIRVSNSTAMVRYLVLPKRPDGTDKYSEEQLAALVTRDTMIGMVPTSSRPGGTGQRARPSNSSSGCPTTLAGWPPSPSAGRARARAVAEALPRPGGRARLPQNHQHRGEAAQGRSARRRDGRRSW